MKQIDLQYYHTNEPCSKNTSISKDLISKIYTQYPNFKNQYYNAFGKYEYKYKPKEKEELLERIVLAIYKESISNKGISKNFTKDNNHQQLTKYICKTIKSILPYIIKNEEFVSSKSYFILEPANVYTMYILNSMYKTITTMDLSKELKGDNILYVLLLNSTIRALRSSMILFSICDDVHALSTFRGALEIMSRYYSLNNSNIEEFKKFTSLNTELQEYKWKGEDIPKESKELYDLVHVKKLTGGRLEGYLLNGWCKNKNGKRIESNTDMIMHAKVFPISISEYSKLSEFTHEDYTFVNYNFQSLRLVYSNIIDIAAIATAQELMEYIKLDSSIGPCIKKLEEYYNNFEF